MTTKVISAKVSEDDYDNILNACNTKGCTISQFVKNACLNTIGKGSEFSESVEAQEKKDDTDKIISDLESKILPLQLQLSSAKDAVSKQNQQIREFYDLVPESELGQRRLEKHLHRLKNNTMCVKIH